MALSEANKAKIRFYLGWPERFHQTDSSLEQAMLAIDTKPDAQTLIEAELTRLASIDTKIDDSANRFKAMKVGSIELPGGLELGLLRSQGRAAVGRIASILGVNVRHDVFSGTGPTSFATWDGPSNSYARN